MKYAQNITTIQHLGKTNNISLRYVGIEKIYHIYKVKIVYYIYQPKLSIYDMRHLKKQYCHTIVTSLFGNNKLSLAVFGDKLHKTARCWPFTSKPFVKQSEKVENIFFRKREKYWNLKIKYNQAQNASISNN